MFVNQVDLSLSMPVLQLLLARDGRRHVSKQFIMNEAINRVFRRETWRKIVAMLIQSLGQVRSHTYVRRAIRLACKDIDAGLFFFSHGWNLTEKWMLERQSPKVKQVQHDGFFGFSALPPIHPPRHLEHTHRHPEHTHRHPEHTHRHPELVSGSILRFAQVLREVL